MPVGLWWPTPPLDNRTTTPPPNRPHRDRTKTKQARRAARRNRT